MFDIGLGEFIVLGILALLVFGPEKLPNVARDAGRALRQFREVAANARRELADGSGADGLDEFKSMADDLRSLNPKRMMQDIMTDAEVTESHLREDVASAGVEATAAASAPVARRTSPLPPPPHVAATVPASAAAAEPETGTELPWDDLALPAEPSPGSTPAAPRTSPLVDSDWS